VTSLKQEEKTLQTKPNNLSDQKTAKTNPLTKKHATHQLLSIQAAREAHTIKAENFGHPLPHPDNTAHLLILTHRHPRESWAQRLRPHIPLLLPDSPPPPLPLLPPLGLPQLPQPLLPQPQMQGNDLGWLWQPPYEGLPLEEETRLEEEAEEEVEAEDHLTRWAKDQ